MVIRIKVKNIDSGGKLGKYLGEKNPCLSRVCYFYCNEKQLYTISNHCCKIGKIHSLDTHFLLKTRQPLSSPFLTDVLCLFFRDGISQLPQILCLTTATDRSISLIYKVFLAALCTTSCCIPSEHRQDFTARVCGNLLYI